MSLSELPVRPRPLQNESIEGYMLRIVARNGWKQTSKLLQHLELHSSFIVGNQEKLIRLCEKLAPCIRIDAEELFTHFKAAHEQTWVCEQHRAIQDLRVRFPRLCPLCVNSTGFDWSWTLTVVSHCQQHGHPLWDYCPKCLQPFEWHSELFTKCSECGSDWEPEQALSLPEHQRELQKRLTSGDELEGYIHDLSEALRAASRPYDSIYDKRGYWPTEQRGLADTLSNAYGLLTQQKEIENWIHGCRQYRSALAPIGPQTVLWPIKELQKSLRGDWPLKEYPIQSERFIEAPIAHKETYRNSTKSWIRPARLKHAITDSDLYFQAHRHEVVNALGLPNGSVDSLINAGLLNPINRTEVARDQLFNLRDLVKLISILSEIDEPPSGYITLQKNDKLLKREGALYADVVAYALIGKTPAFRTKGSLDLSMIWVEEKALSTFLLNICENFVRNRQAR